MGTLSCGKPAQVITEQSEENQEGTLCGFDKQAQRLSKHQRHGLRPLLALALRLLLSLLSEI